MVGHNTEDVSGIPIPTYDEAVASTSASAQAHLGPAESSDDAERQGLLVHGAARRLNGQSASRLNAYRPPTVESERNSSDGDLTSLASTRSSDDRLRHELSQMEIEEPASTYARTAQSMRNNLTKRITHITRSLSSISLPFQERLPSLAWLKDRLLRSPTPILMVIGRLLALLLVFGVVYFFASEISLGRGGMRQTYDAESIREFVHDHVDTARLRATLEHLTDYDHMAGTKGDYWLAQYVEKQLEAADLDRMESSRYEVYLNFPRDLGRSVRIMTGSGSGWSSRLVEQYEEGIPPGQRTPAFHAHSMASNVQGPLFYANYGSKRDFERLKQMGLDMTGAIVLVRSGGIQPDPALKIRAAAQAGAAGCLIYTDPNDNGASGGQSWPSGRFTPWDGVQRDSVSLTSWVVGDVLTPGWASLPDAPRKSKRDNPGLVNIPSLPLSARDAQKLLQSLQGNGKQVPDEWKGGIQGIQEWWTGDSSSTTLKLVNEQDEVDKRPILNVFGTIGGIEQSEKTVIIGAHRDSWCLGAADAGSGTAILLELAAVFGELSRLGWRPLRTIQFASWDASKYNLAGSTEWVEDNLPGLRLNGVAYMNIDAAVTGDSLRASASPVFQGALLRMLERVTDPVKNKTLRAIWEDSKSQLGSLRADSDHVAFQSIAGTSSIDVSFDGPGYPKHSCYDSFEWMTKFGDPDFKYHTMLAQVLALLILEIADQPVLPYDFEAYARTVEEHVVKLKQDVLTRGEQAKVLDLTPLSEAAQRFKEDAISFQVWGQEWKKILNGSGGIESNVLAIKRMSHNSRMSNFETHLLDLKERGGIPGRDQFKHVIYGPPGWSDPDRAEFPAIRDALLEGNWPGAQLQIDKAAAILTKASRKLLN